MKSKKVVYDCLLLSESAIKKVLKITDMFYGKIIANSNMKVINKMHCTLRYMGGEKNRHKRKFQLCNEELHQQASICVAGIGIYREEGNLLNVGLLVDVDKSIIHGVEIPKEKLFDSIPAHITVMINATEGIANAADTAKCFSYYNADKWIAFDDIYLDATTEAMAGDYVAKELDDFPEMRERRAI